MLDNRPVLPEAADRPRQYIPDAPLRDKAGNLLMREDCRIFSGLWGYHRDESSWKSVPFLIKMLIERSFFRGPQSRAPGKSAVFGRTGIRGLAFPRAGVTLAAVVGGSLMPKFKVLVTDHVFEHFDREKSVLSPLDAELVVREAEHASELVDDVVDADAILNTYLPGIDRELLKHGKKLRAVVRYGIGVDTINIPHATELGIMVANVADYCINEVADHALALFLTLGRKTAFSDTRVKGGEWSLSFVKPMKAAREMTAGIVGFGRIGRAIAARLRPFGINVVFSDPGVTGNADGARNVEFDTLLAASDVIFIQCPANDATHHLIDGSALNKTSKCPLLINTARGSIVDTDAVVQALQAGKLSGAGLDVLEDEDAVVKADHPLKQFDNVVMTPHSAWFSDAAIPELQKRAAEQVALVLRGERPTSLLNPEVLESKR
jgi:D-3-phosphoglycerate dehydrogenase